MLYTLLFLLLSPVLAIPTRRDVSAVLSSQVSWYTPYTYFASAAYCKPTATLTWSCGVNCRATAGFQTTATGGDGQSVQFWYVGYSPSLQTVVVGHQGTDPESLLSLLVDADASMTKLNSTLFPGVPSSVQVHHGFAKSHSITAPPILNAVKITTKAHNTTSITLVGHSLGAALTLLDAVYLPLQLGSEYTYQTIGYGMPRVGNQYFANYVDLHVNLTRITNKMDPIPIIPGRGLGYHHPSGEIHIEQDNGWDACSGQDNTSKLCIVGAVPNLLVSKESDHDGPYNGVTMGC